MAIVQSISKKAEKALLAHGITFSYGYGDAYHFGSGIPGETSVDIKPSFVLDQDHFVVVGSRLQLAEEGKGKHEKISDQQ